MATKKSSRYQISGAGVLSIDSSEYFRTDRGQKQIESLKELQRAFEARKRRSHNPKALGG